MSVSEALAAGGLANLPPAEQQLLHQKKLVLKTQKSKKSVWPKITIYATINSSPLESVAVYYALDYQKEYVPDLLKSRPIKHISPTEVHTAYTLNVPWPLPNSSYINGTKLSTLNGGGYRIDWYMVESDAADETTGNAQFIPLEKGKTLLIYTSFMRPKSFFARFIKKLMIKNSLKSITVIRDHIELVKRERAGLMNKFKARIVGALAGQNVYEDLIKSGFK